MLPLAHVVPRSPTRATHIPLDNSPVISTPKFSCGRGIPILTSRSPVRQLSGGKREAVGAAATGVEKVIQ